MNIFKLMVIGVAAALASGCATRGSIRITCDNFGEYVAPVKPSRLITEIQGDDGSEIRAAAAVRGESPLLSPLARYIKTRSLRSGFWANSVDGVSRSGAPNILLLSGGGQWGAFGAGFLKELQTGKSARPVHFDVITGVSTGGLQSLFVAIDAVDGAAYQKLAKNYRPEKESEIISRNRLGKPGAVITGSFAGLRPLRRRIEAALCTSGDPAQGCPLIDALAGSGRVVYIGFVNARSGAFEYADVTRMAVTGVDSGTVGGLRNAQQCLTGVALASAAMPVFFQQVKINDEAYYDGGVRLSVFEAAVSGDVDKGYRVAASEYAEKAALKDHGITLSPSPALYIVRNGPTRLLDPDSKPGDDPVANRGADALRAAERAEAILVNQLEVGSIAALRLTRPKGPINLVTADGFDGWDTGSLHEPGCSRSEKKGVMFDPTFMACLQRFGAFKARWDSPWIALSELDDIVAKSAAP